MNCILTIVVTTSLVTAARFPAARVSRHLDKPCSDRGCPNEDWVCCPGRWHCALTMEDCREFEAKTTSHEETTTYPHEETTTNPHEDTATYFQMIISKIISFLNKAQVLIKSNQSLSKMIRNNELHYPETTTYPDKSNWSENMKKSGQLREAFNKKKTFSYWHSSISGGNGGSGASFVNKKNHS